MIPDGTGALIKNLIHWHTHTHILNVRTTTVLSQKIPHFFLHHTVIPPWHDMTQRYIQIIEESVGMNIHCFVGTMFTMARNPDRETLRPFGHQSQYCPRKLLPIPHTAGIEEPVRVVLYFVYLNHWQQTGYMQHFFHDYEKLGNGNRSQPSHWYRYLWRSTNEAQESRPVQVCFAAIWLLVHSPKLCTQLWESISHRGVSKKGLCKIHPTDSIKHDEPT